MHASFCYHESYVRGVEGIYSIIIPDGGIVRARQWELRMTYANLICLRASSSGSTQLCQLGSPYDMQPSIILEIFSPELPRDTSESVEAYGYISEYRKPLITYHTASLVGSSRW